MIFAIKLSIYALSSILMAAIVNRKMFLSDLGKKVVVFWIAVIPFAFIIRHELLTVIACFTMLFMLKKNMSPSMCIAFFIATLAAVPDWPRYLVSLPGINKLTVLFFWKVSVLALLLPLFFQLKKAAYLKWSFVDTLVCLFVIYISLMSFRDDNFTTFLRILLDNTLMYIIPYFVISRFIASCEDFHYAALGFFMLTAIIACVLFVSQILKEDFYREFNTYGSWVLRIVEYRSGFLRLGGPYAGVLSGYLLGAGIVALTILKQYFPMGRLMYWGMLFVFFSAIMFSGSRGALASVLIALSIYIYFGILNGGMRMAAFGVVLLLVILGLVFDVASLLSYDDEYGTFDYRKELYAASFEFIKTSFFFGDSNYIYSGYFDHLVTGLGIIDIVSVFLQVMLRYGVVGLFLHTAPFVILAFTLTFQSFSSSNRHPHLRQYSAMFLGLLLGYLFLIGTTSTVSLVDNFGVIMLAFARSLTERKWT